MLCKHIESKSRVMRALRSKAAVKQKVLGIHRRCYLKNTTAHCIHWKLEMQTWYDVIWIYHPPHVLKFTGQHHIQVIAYETQANHPHHSPSSCISTNKVINETNHHFPDIPSDQWGSRLCICRVISILGGKGITSATSLARRGNLC